MGATFKGKNPLAGIRKASHKGMDLAVEHILGEARKVVPIEESTLEKSGAASSEQTDKGVRGAVSFDTPYLRSCAA